jgi:hypothetical protein
MGLFISRLLAPSRQRVAFVAEAAQPPLQALPAAVGGRLGGTFGQGHLGGVLQRQGQLRTGLEAPRRVHFQALQDHLLQPGRAVGPQLARRHGVFVQAPAQPAHVLGLAEGPPAGGEVVQHDAQREEVAARVLAHELHLLGRHVRAGAHGQLELFFQQVGQLVVARQAEVHQHRGAVGR